MKFINNAASAAAVVAASTNLMSTKAATKAVNNKQAAEVDELKHSLQKKKAAANVSYLYLYITLNTVKKKGVV